MSNDEIVFETHCVVWRTDLQFISEVRPETLRFETYEEAETWAATLNTPWTPSIFSISTENEEELTQMFNTLT